MRINVYTEEMPNGKPGPNCEIVTANYVSARTGQPMTNYGLRIFLRSPESLHFIPGRDDDRSAVTFWCGDKASNLMLLVDMLKQCVEIDNLERFRKKVGEACDATVEAEKVRQMMPRYADQTGRVTQLDPVALARAWERGEEPSCKLSAVYPPVDESNPD